MCLLQTMSGLGVLPFSYSLRKSLQGQRDTFHVGV